MSRDDRPTDLERDSRRYLASYVLFNQAVADHLGMHPTDVQCLSLLGNEPGPFTTGRIAELTGLTSGSATRLVDRLEKGGYITRRRDARDRRRVLVEPVPAAMRRLGEFWDSLAEGRQAMFDGYTDQEMALLGRHMRRTTELAKQQIERLRALPPR